MNGTPMLVRVSPTRILNIDHVISLRYEPPRSENGKPTLLVDTRRGVFECDGEQASRLFRFLCDYAEEPHDAEVPSPRAIAAAQALMPLLQKAALVAQVPIVDVVARRIQKSWAEEGGAA